MGEHDKTARPQSASRDPTARSSHTDGASLRTGRRTATASVAKISG
jgi:hypothetical protein